MDLNLENPIFIIYVDVDGLSNTSAASKLDQVKKLFYYDNVTSWIIADKINKVELIWQGSKFSNNPGFANIKGVENLYIRINEILEVLENGTSDESLRQQLRNLQLNKVLDDSSF